MNTNITLAGDAAGLGTAVLLVLLVVIRVFAPDRILSPSAYRRAWINFIVANAANIFLGLVNSTVFGLLAEPGNTKLLSLVSLTYLVPTFFWILFYLSIFHMITGHRLPMGSKSRDGEEKE